MNSKNKKQYNDEVDLLGTLLIIWNNRWKIFLPTFVAMFVMFVYQINQKQTAFKVTTEIRPISIYELAAFDEYNLHITKYFQKYNINIIDKEYLLDLFISKLSIKESFKYYIKKFNLIKKEDYADQEAYENAVTELAFTVKLSPSEENEYTNFWRLSFTTENIEGWKEVLKNVELDFNKEIKMYLRDIISTKIDGFKRTEQFEIEDIEIQIENSLLQYEREIKKRLAFLEEQAKLARVLGINGYDDTLTYNVSTSYFVRGYEAIEKEMEIIQSRTNKKIFTANYLLLKKKQVDLSSDKSIERLEIIANEPFVSPNGFKTAKILIESSNIEKSIRSIKKNIIYAGIATMIFSILWLLVANALRNYE
jgi:LPS O-antigen subunit length determinant protein (WzzB/FepE family)